MWTISKTQLCSTSGTVELSEGTKKGVVHSIFWGGSKQLEKASYSLRNMSWTERGTSCLKIQCPSLINATIYFLATFNRCVSMKEQTPLLKEPEPRIQTLYLPPTLSYVSSHHHEIQDHNFHLTYVYLILSD